MANKTQIAYDVRPHERLDEIRASKNTLDELRGRVEELRHSVEELQGVSEELRKASKPLMGFMKLLKLPSNARRAEDSGSENALLPARSDQGKQTGSHAALVEVENEHHPLIEDDSSSTASESVYEPEEALMSSAQQSAPTDSQTTCATATALCMSARKESCTPYVNGEPRACVKRKTSDGLDFVSNKYLKP